MGGMSELPMWARDALAGVYDPCCREKGISVLDMGLVRSVQVENGVARVELLLTSGWCPFAATVLTHAGLMFDNHLYAFHTALTPDDQPKLPPDEFLRQWTPSGVRKVVY